MNTKFDNVGFKELNLKIDKAFKESSIPGMSIGLIKDSELVYSNSFGVMNLKSQAPVTGESLFQIASLSKAFVGVAIMQLVEKGLIELDSRIVDCLPNFKVNSPLYKQITVQHLLNHNSGLTTIRGNPWKKPEIANDALENEVRSYKKEKLKFTPGEKFLYSNKGFVILGEVIAKISGMSFESYIKDNILLPLGMNLSTFLYQEADPKYLASPHMRTFVFFGKPAVFKHHPYTRGSAPANCMQTNILDMSKWAAFHINKGSLGGKEILKKKSFESLHKSVFPVNVETGVYAGLGWFISQIEGHKAFSYTGTDPGFKATIIIIPELKIAMIVLYNTLLESTKEVHAIVREAMFDLANNK